MSPRTPNPRTWRFAWEMARERGNGDREVIAYLPGSFSRDQMNAVMIAVHESIAMDDDSDRFDVVWKWRHPEVATPRPEWGIARLCVNLDMADSGELVARRVRARLVNGAVEVERQTVPPGSAAARHLAGLDR